MPTSRERIEKWSFGYWLLRFYQNMMFRLYFKTEIVGLEKLPKNTTFIFAPNHQNALIDALAMLTLNHSWQPVFLARADIFNKPLISKILTFLKIMPVYRIRDGYENLSLNDRIFQKTMDIIRNGNGLVILPEGNHDGFKRLRQLKKGIARIALQTEDASDGTLNIHIVPVGLDYSNYVRYRSKLLIRIGEPFPVKKYLELYRQNKALAYNSLVGELAERMKKEMIHVEDEHNYESYTFLSEFFANYYVKLKGLPKTQNNNFEIRKRLIAKLDELKQNNTNRFNSIISKSNELLELMRQYKLKQRALPLRVSKAFNLVWMIPFIIIASPIALFGFLNHLLPILLPFWLSKKFKDVQFHSSVKHAASLLLVLILYPLQVVVVGLAFKSLVISLIYFLSLPVSAFILFHWRRVLYKIMGISRVVRLGYSKRNEFEKVNKLYSELLPELAAVYEV
jgi:1-acyl-sn-glycerol-3-phosphate acyltransferase